MKLCVNKNGDWRTYAAVVWEFNHPYDRQQWYSTWLSAHEARNVAYDGLKVLGDGEEVVEDNDVIHRHKACNFRYGKSDNWSTNTNCRKRFLNELLNIALSPTFRNEFLGMLNQKLEHLIPDQDSIVVDQNQTVAKVKVLHSTALPRPIFIATRYSQIVNLTQEKVRNIAGSYCSRRELQRSVQMLRSTGLRPPKNIAKNMSAERKILQNQMSD